MLTKTILVASAIACVSAEQAKVPSSAQRSQKVVASKPAVSKVAAASVGASTAVTSGAYSRLWYINGGSCASPDSEPWVDGYTLNECRQSSSSSSFLETACEFNSDKSTLTISRSTYASGDCTGTATMTTYAEASSLVDGCSGSYAYECGTDVNVAKYGSPQHIGNYDNGSCSGNEWWWEIFFYSSCTDDSSCTVSGTYDSWKGICDDPDDTCFHVDTKIDYKGVEYTYEELKAGKESECTVPHTPASKGVVISTSCDKTVRVTDTHLMATTKGFQLAYSLKAGDVLYGDYGKDMCTVKSVEKEKTTQQYFGLNCVHSEVLASGLRASTFGDFHTLPSWYMTYVGGLVGSETASSLGEYIAEWYFQK